MKQREFKKIPMLSLVETAGCCSWYAVIENTQVCACFYVYDYANTGYNATRSTSMNINHLLVLGTPGQMLHLSSQQLQPGTAISRSS